VTALLRARSTPSLRSVAQGRLEFCTRLFALLIAASAAAQSAPRIQLSHTTESLRGVSAVSRQIAWASGTHGTYLRTVDGGRTWNSAQVPDATQLDFRAVVAFDANEAFLMSAGPGDQSRIYHTTDAGRHWQMQFTNTNPKGFFDSMVFWDRTHGIVLGDPIPDDSPENSTKDESGKLKFQLLLTDDGQTWRPIPPSQLPPALAGEGAFAASNTCIAILTAEAALKSAAANSTSIVASTPTVAIPTGFVSTSVVIPRSEATRNLLSAETITIASAATMPAQPWKSGASAPRQPDEEKGASAPNPNIWFATGGRAARVFHSPDRGQTWQVFDTPILHGPDSAGIFSIAFRDALHGVIAGGDYKYPNDDGPNLAFTDDGGKTWTLSTVHPLAYFSGVAYDRSMNQAAILQQQNRARAESAGKKTRVKPASPQRLFLVGQDFIFDFLPPANPARIAPEKKLGIKFNAVSSYPRGGALIVGPKGAIVSVP
jgi:photosystem II stability/assembly factor-like uncharacterized protein